MVSPVRGQSVLAIIPARGGSKSIPRKNIKLLHGIPLIAYSIAAGLQANRVNRVIVSTDDDEIAKTARRFGTEVPFMRHTELALDDTPDLPVFQHALTWLRKHENYIPDVIVQLRPTSPFRPPKLVDQAVDILLDNKTADSVRTVIPSGQNPYKMWRAAKNGYINPLLKATGIAEPYNAPRQKLPLTYWQTGHVDAIRYKTIMTKSSMSGRRILPVILDPRYAIDIDTEADWSYAEWFMDHLNLSIVRPEYSIGPSLGLLEKLRLLVLDFDGVLTDNRVMINAKGEEAVIAHRGDGSGIARLKDAGMKIIVLSTETNPIVEARCRKLKIDFIQGLSDKLSALKLLVKKYKVPLDEVAYMGNDVNDLACMQSVGMPIAVADAAPEALAAAKWITTRPGGYGAVREVADILMEKTFGKNIR